MSPNAPSPLIPPGSTIAALKKLTYSDEAAQALREKYPNTTVENLNTIEQVVASIQQGWYVVLPIESYVAGPVGKHRDLLLQGQGKIIAEVNVGVAIYPGGAHAGALSTARSAASHPKGIEQCSRFLAAHPHIEGRQFCDSTADAAEIVGNRVKQYQDETVIALASKPALLANDLTLLTDQSVSDFPGGGTQMYVLQKNGSEALPRSGARFHALDLRPENQPRVLAHILHAIARNRLDLRSLHSYPRGKDADGKDQHGFFMELFDESGTARLHIMQSTLEVMRAHPSVQWLGSWDEALEVGELSTEAEPDYPDQLITQGSLDVTKPEISVRLVLKNRPGVLADVLQLFHYAGMDLTLLQSYSLGRKRYGFSVTMRPLKPCTEETGRELMAELSMHRDLASLEWL
ncbi:MAG: prephenate dehydratase domain-containing protein [Candidatus Peregrinibacteria bacterium]|nr:prephenate dehydratase domain-containing protein [Candidatus Peregrinibacteria bacterium]